MSLIDMYFQPVLKLQGQFFWLVQHLKMNYK